MQSGLQVLLAGGGIAADFEQRAQGIGSGRRAAAYTPCPSVPRPLCSALFRFEERHRTRMAMNFLDFEQPIAELEAKIDELKFVSSDAEVNIGEEIARLRAKSRALTTSIFSNLTQWQIAQLARHPQRPVHARLHRLDLHRLPGAARRPHVRRRSRHRRRAGASRRPAGHDHRPAEGPRHQGARAPQLRHAEAGGLSQGAAPDAHGRALPDAADHVDRHVRRLSRRRRRGARPERGDRAQPVRDVDAAKCRSSAS